MRIGFGIAAGWGIVALALHATAQEERPTGLDALTVSPGFSVEIAATPDLTSYPMFMAFDDRGRMFIAESSGKDLSGKEMVEAPECLILLLEDSDRDGRFDTRKVFADTLSLPMGVLWHQGSLYVASPPEFIRLTDTDDDGVADQREVLLSGWNILNTASLHGPFAGPDGWLYLTHGRHGYSIQSKEGQLLEGQASRIWRCRPDGTGLERMAGGGFDNPVELVFMGGGDCIGTMTYFTDPRNGERDALMHWVEGGVYPKPHESTAEFVRTGPLMPILTKFARIAPAGLERYRSTAFGPKYKDNLFSAQFNPHRVQRHVLAREGASFTCRDEDFLVSSDPDFHPTDVLEDADGSILVCDTGAWYVDACPISRVARPEIRGAVYRIRREDTSTFQDVWGKEIDWETIDPDALAALLDDGRPKVRDRAVETLVARASDAVEALEKAVRSKQVRVRESAVWALGRIVAPGSHPALRVALHDFDPAVKMAAARMTGLAGDSEAARQLEALLDDADAGVRRQAATALGQIGATDAADALLAACDAPADRFEEHALVFAAITLKAETAASTALNANEENVRRCALIALDQMGSDVLTADVVLPFLECENASLRDAGLWVASHHAEWSEVVLAFAESRLEGGDADETQRAALHDVLLAYSADPRMHDMLARVLIRQDLSGTTALFLLDVMAEAAVEEFPEPWIAALKGQMESTDAELRWRALDVIRTRGVAALDEDLLRITMDAAESPDLRLAALGAALPRRKTLSPDALEFVLGQMKEDIDPTLRLEAARLLADAALDQSTLVRLAVDIIPAADALTFPAVLNAFRANREDEVGLALIHGLEQAKVNPGMVPGGLDAVLSGFSESVLEAAKPLKAQTEVDAAARIERLEQLEPKLGTGDVGRGRQVFFGPKANCYTCHAIGDDGGRLGPDLTRIGEVRSGHDLLEAVLFPSASFVPDYEPYRLKTVDSVYEGVVAKQDQDSVLLAVSVDSQVRIPRGEITEMKLGGVSIMPEGLDVALAQEELIDLMAFLQSLNGEDWLLPERRN